MERKFRINKLPKIPKNFIYLIECKKNKKIYIGQTKNTERRINEHLAGEGSKKLLYDLVEYGRKAFTFSIIDSCLEGTDLLEDYYIKKYDSINHGYNCMLNMEPIPIDAADEFTLIAKYIGRDLFTIGRRRLYNEYRKLMNIKASNLKHNTFKGNDFYVINVKAPESYKKNKDYTLNIINGTYLKIKR